MQARELGSKVRAPGQAVGIPGHKSQGPELVVGIPGHSSMEQEHKKASWHMP